MTNGKQELAKSFAWVAANQTIVQWALGLSEVLPSTHDRTAQSACSKGGCTKSDGNPR